MWGHCCFNRVLRVGPLLGGCYFSLERREEIIQVDTLKKSVSLILTWWRKSRSVPGMFKSYPRDQIRSDKSISRVRLFVTPWIAARQASLSITNSQSSLRLTSIESVMPSSHLILCRPLLLLPLIPSSIRVFSKESTLRMRWPKYWSFSFSISPSKEIWGLISFRMDWLDLLRDSWW